MARSLKKGIYINENLIKKISRDQSGKLKTYSRSSTISPEMIDLTIEVYNGKEFVPVKVIEEMVGHKLGEFVSTTKFVRHGGKLQRAVETKQSSSEQNNSILC